MLPSIGIIGGADGPTAVFVSGGLSWGWIFALIGVAVVAAAALALLALVVWLSNRHRS
mgnify:CR=1 FL=1